MKVYVDERLKQEVNELQLRFTCEDCAHFNPDADACSEGYPSAAHRRRPLVVGEVLMFCKHFEVV